MSYFLKKIIEIFILNSILLSVFCAAVVCTYSFDLNSYVQSIVLIFFISVILVIVGKREQKQTFLTMNMIPRTMVMFFVVTLVFASASRFEYFFIKYLDMANVLSLFCKENNIDLESALYALRIVTKSFAFSLCGKVLFKFANFPYSRVKIIPVFTFDVLLCFGLLIVCDAALTVLMLTSLDMDLWEVAAFLIAVSNLFYVFLPYCIGEIAYEDLSNADDRENEQSEIIWLDILLKEVCRLVRGNLFLVAILLGYSFFYYNNSESWLSYWGVGSCVYALCICFMKTGNSIMIGGRLLEKVAALCVTFILLNFFVLCVSEAVYWFSYLLGIKLGIYSLFWQATGRSDEFYSFFQIGSNLIAKTFVYAAFSSLLYIPSTFPVTGFNAPVKLWNINGKNLILLLGLSFTFFIAYSLMYYYKLSLSLNALCAVYDVVFIMICLAMGKAVNEESLLIESKVVQI